MDSRRHKLFALLLAASCLATLLNVQSASAQDLFSLFGGIFGGARKTAPPMSYAPDNAEERGIRRNSLAQTSGGGTYCVRTCDGRYFPLPAVAGQSKAESCKSFCPASETKVFYGGNIDHATTDSGKSYSDLPNAFRFRTELVAGCSCNGTDSVGLARIKIEDDKTLRRGDIVSGPEGLMTATRGAERGRTALSLSPAAASVQAQYSRLPVVAQQ